MDRLVEVPLVSATALHKAQRVDMISVNPRTLTASLARLIRRLTVKHLPRHHGLSFLELLEVLRLLFRLLALQSYVGFLGSAQVISPRRRHLRRPRRQLHSSLSQPFPQNQNTPPPMLVLLPTKLQASRLQRRNSILPRRCAPRPITMFQKIYPRTWNLNKKFLQR